MSPFSVVIFEYVGFSFLIHCFYLSGRKITSKILKEIKISQYKQGSKYRWIRIVSATLCILDIVQASFKNLGTSADKYCSPYQQIQPIIYQYSKNKNNNQKKSFFFQNCFSGLLRTIFNLDLLNLNVQCTHIDTLVCYFRHVITQLVYLSISHPHDVATQLYVIYFNCQVYSC